MAVQRRGRFPWIPTKITVLQKEDEDHLFRDMEDPGDK
jgi:hypothetical protein